MQKKGPPKLHPTKSKAHPGFKAEQKKLTSQGMSKKESGAILGAAYRKELGKRGK